MNFGLILSYIIAGFLIVIITTVGYNTNFSGNELTLQEIQKTKVSEVVETLTYDFPKIGYNRNSLPDTLIRAAGDDFIEFYANIDNSADESLELIRWEFTSDSVTSTPNPNDFVLKRTVNGSTVEMNAGVVDFEIRYYSSLGSTTPLPTPIYAKTAKSTIDSITQIEIIMNTQSSVGLKRNSFSNDSYVSTSWTKRFSPVNLRDN